MAETKVQETDQRGFEEKKRLNFDEIFARYLASREGILSGRAIKQCKDFYETWLKDSVGEKYPEELELTDAQCRPKNGRPKDGELWAQVHVFGLIRTTVNYGIAHGYCSALKFKVPLPEMQQSRQEECSRH